MALHQWSADQPINICGISCISNLKGRFSNVRWMWDGLVQCDSKAPGVYGMGSAAGRKGAITSALEKFIEKAIKAGYAKSEDFQC